jgi:hypothetical protein
MINYSSIHQYDYVIILIIIRLLHLKSNHILTKIFIINKEHDNYITMMSSEDDPPDDSKTRANLRGVNEALDALKQSLTGTHCLVVYPDLPSLRAIYSKYTKSLLEDNNEIVLFLSYYDTPDMVRLVLSGKNSVNGNIKGNYVGYSGIDLEKYEKDGALIIRDSLKAHIDTFRETRRLQHNANDQIKNMNLTTFLRILTRHAARRQKYGITIFLDMGLFYHGQIDHRIERLERFESTIPRKREFNTYKVFCLYHQRDFERRFSQEQQATLLDYHNRNIMLVTAK